MGKITQVANGDSGLVSRNKINEAMKTVERTGSTLLGDGTVGNEMEVDTVPAPQVSYDNIVSGLVADNIKDATDELQAVKADADAITAGLILYKTTAASPVGGYTRLVTDPSDPDYDNPAVDVSTGSITGLAQLIGSQASDPGLIVGDTGIISVPTIGNIRRASGTGTASFYFEVYHRTDVGVETLIGTSSNTQAPTSATYEQFNAAALIANTAFIITDRIVFKVYADRIAGGVDPVYELQFGGTAPVRSPFPFPTSSFCHDALACVTLAQDTVEFGHISDQAQTIVGEKTFSDTMILGDALNEAKGIDIASATTTDIGAATGNYVDITGTTAITGFGTVQAGTKRIVQFDGILILTHNGTSLILPTGANITTAVGDTCEMISLGSGNWICVNYQRADGTALASVGGGGGMWTLDSTNTISTATNTITINPTSYKRYRIIFVGRASVTAIPLNMVIIFNGDSGSNYMWSVSDGISSGAGTSAQLTFGQGTWVTTPSNTVYATMEIENTSGEYTLMKGEATLEYSGATQRKYSLGNIWRNTASITSMQFNTNNVSRLMDIGTQILIYGNND